MNVKIACEASSLDNTSQPIIAMDVATMGLTNQKSWWIVTFMELKPFPIRTNKYSFYIFI